MRLTRVRSSFCRETDAAQNGNPEICKLFRFLKERQKKEVGGGWSSVMMFLWKTRGVGTDSVGWHGFSPICLKADGVWECHWQRIFWEQKTKLFSPMDTANLLKVHIFGKAHLVWNQWDYYVSRQPQPTFLIGTWRGILEWRLQYKYHYQNIN